jgi:hypothetical protein
MCPDLIVIPVIVFLAAYAMSIVVVLMIVSKHRRIAFEWYGNLMEDIESLDAMSMSSRWILIIVGSILFGISMILFTLILALCPVLNMIIAFKELHYAEWSYKQFRN